MIGLRDVLQKFKRALSSRQMLLFRSRKRVVPAILTALLLGYHAVFERANIYVFTHTAALTMCLVAGVTLLTRRLNFALFVAAAFIALVVIVSAIKTTFLNMAFHAYDFVFYLGSSGTVRFLIVHFTGYVAAVLMLAAGLLALGRVVYQKDGTRILRSVSFASIVALATLGYATSQAGKPPLLAYFAAQYPLTLFYNSVPSAYSATRQGTLFEARRHPDAKAFAVRPPCDTSAKTPHIILVHQESVFPPEFFPSIKHAPELDSFFRSFDGQLHKMRVEIFGGGSWMSEFSVITGVSTLSFGAMRFFVEPLMTGRVHDAFPQILQHCGYENTLFYPMDKNFIGEDAFFASVGLGEIIDRTDQGSTTFYERDRFFYGNALKFLEGRIGAGRTKRQFLYIQTMATHFPYDWPVSAEEAVPGGGVKGSENSEEFNEYLRRLWFAKLDFEAFRSGLARRFPKEQFVIVLYGDHQPRLTRTLPEIDQPGSGNLNRLAARSRNRGLDMTYYAVHGVNFTPPPLPRLEVVDIAYLGAVMLKSAGVTLPQSYQERLRLMEVCDGRYYDCSDRQQILTFHGQLIDSGLFKPN